MKMDNKQELTPVKASPIAFIVMTTLLIVFIGGGACLLLGLANEAKASPLVACIVVYLFMNTKKSE